MRMYEEYREHVEQALVPMLTSLGDIPPQLMDAMSYSLKAGGKRIRPVLLLAACEMAGGQEQAAMPFACALEMIHTYSLIHDDLPAMDNDDLRRGKPTNHRVFGEDMAILAGDGLLNAAAEVMARAAIGMGDLRGIRAMEIIMRHAGVSGMIAGQAEDVRAAGREADEAFLTRIHTLKTSELLEAAVESGIALAGGNEEQIRAGGEYALHTGLAFQITDDILDEIGDAAQMGKNPHSDAEAKKVTWTTMKGIDGARADAEKEIGLAAAALKRLPWDASFFARFAQDILDRNK